MGWQFYLKLVKKSFSKCPKVQFIARSIVQDNWAELKGRRVEKKNVAANLARKFKKSPEKWIVAACVDDYDDRHNFHELLLKALKHLQKVGVPIKPELVAYNFPRGKG